mgnify:CR=1 FL=1
MIHWNETSCSQFAPYTGDQKDWLSGVDAAEESEKSWATINNFLTSVRALSHDGVCQGVQRG